MKNKIIITLALLISVSVKAQTYFNVETDFPCSGCGHPTAELSKMKVYEYKTIKSYFDSIANFSAIEFNFPQGGCQQRAQIMSMLLSKKFNIEHARVWIFAPIDLDPDDKRTLFITDKNGLSPNNTIQWNYHVAPVVLVKKGTGVDTLVIDPSIDKTQPISLSKWLQAIGNSQISKYTFLNADRYFFNVKFDANGNTTTVINGFFYDFSNPAKDNLTMEKGLAINDMAIIIFNKYIKPLSQSTAGPDVEKLKDLKAIFGNASALDYLFSQNISGKTDKTTHRYAMINYGDIMLDAKQIFNKRMQYWTTVTTILLNK
jgi:hypothetical protein